MTIRPPRLPGSRRGAAVGIALLVGILAGTTQAAAVPPRQPLVVVLSDHAARAHPNVHARYVETVAALRPLTRVRTVLPVLGDAKRGSWLRVRLPGRPNGHAGWIRAADTRHASTGWRLALDLSARRVTVFRDGNVVRRFDAVVGNPWTPTPRGRFFVEEALALSHQVGGPFALATSARSTVLQEFEGGPGQIALHGTNGLAGALGSAASHGCIRLGTGAITWLAGRIGAGVPLTIAR